MAKFCTNCGAEMKEGADFCSSCGTGAKQSKKGTGTPVVIKREIAVAIILSIITCGIYGLYWMICLNDEANKVSGDNTTSGGMVLLLTIVTCGIYAIYWSYKQGQKLYTAGKQYGKEIADNSVLYLVLNIFGLWIVNYCLMQNDLNKFAE